MVYIVTTGEYSDYRIVAVFAARQEAETYTNGSEKPEGKPEHTETNIEEWEFGPPDGTVFFQRVYHHSLKLDGSDDFVSTSWKEVPQEYTQVNTVPDMNTWSKYPWRYCAIAESVISAKHAKKLAVEARQAWIVRNPQ